MAQKTYASHLQLLSDKRWQALARQAPVRSGLCGHPPRPRTQTCLTPTISVGWLPRTRSTPSPEKTLLAFTDHGSLDERLEPDCAAAERAIAAAADAGIDADALAEHLQRYGAGAFTAD